MISNKHTFIFYNKICSMWWLLCCAPFCALVLHAIFKYMAAVHHERFFNVKFVGRILCRKVGNYIFFLNLLLKDLWQLYIRTTVCKIHKSQHIQGRFWMVCTIYISGMFCIGELGLNQNDVSIWFSTLYLDIEHAHPLCY